MGFLLRLRRSIRRLVSWVLGRPFSASPFAPGTGPTRLVVLRHAEKTGNKRDPHLSPAGRQRAERLVDYIPATFGQPDFLIAARSSKRSRRPVATLEPLAAALGLEIKAKIDDDDVGDLIRMLRDKPRLQGLSGVISWRHSELPGLIDALGAAPGTVPTSWDENDYTTIVDINYTSTGEVQARRMRMPF
jgi:hypothetical protein